MADFGLSISVGVNFELGLVDYAAIEVTDGGTPIGVYDNSPDVAFSSDGSFAVSGLQEAEGSSYTGGIEGRFIGTNADGALVAFEVREIDGTRRIVGSRILKQIEP